MKTIKRIITLAILAGAVYGFYKFYAALENREPAKIDRAEQAEAQRRMSIDLRVYELEKSGGKGRIRLNKDVENAARLIYNCRHPSASLPLL